MRRLGTFEMQYPQLHDYPLMCRVQAGMVVLRVDHLLVVDRVKIWAEGAMFEEIPQGAIIPAYSVTFTRSEAGDVIDVAFEREEGPP